MVGREERAAEAASAGAATGARQILFCDSSVTVGCVAKGRSSSYKLNGILRGLLPWLIVGRIVLCLLWVGTAANIADYPSRFKELPQPTPPPAWAASVLPNLGVAFAGWGLELFAGSARLTRAFKALGCAMLTPWEITTDPMMDVLSPRLDAYLRAVSLAWVWMAPPCKSFSAIRNLDPGGPLRSRTRPQGDSSNPEVALGNSLWRRTLSLARTLLKRGVDICIEHPAGSYAWYLPETKSLIDTFKLKVIRLDWCAFDSSSDPNLKPTIVITSAPWVARVQGRCPRTHVHGPELRGRRAADAAAYPWLYCEALAVSYVRHLEEQGLAGIHPAGRALARGSRSAVGRGEAVPAGELAVGPLHDGPLLAPRVGVVP